MTSIYYFVEGDTGSKLQVTCKNDDDNSAINLTGCTVKIKWKTASNISIVKTMTITNAVSGITEYQFGDSELFYGTMYFEIEITDATSKKIKSLDLIEAKVRKVL